MGDAAGREAEYGVNSAKTGRWQSRAAPLGPDEIRTCANLLGRGVPANSAPQRYPLFPEKCGRLYCWQELLYCPQVIPRKHNPRWPKTTETVATGPLGGRTGARAPFLETDAKKRTCRRHIQSSRSRPNPSGLHPRRARAKLLPRFPLIICNFLMPSAAPPARTVCGPSAETRGNQRFD